MLKTMKIQAIIENLPEITWVYEVTDEEVIYKQGTASPSSIHYVGNDKLHIAKLRNNTKGPYFLVQGTKYYLNNLTTNI